MILCRCPYCHATFQVSSPPESEYWDNVPIDEDGLAMWVCLECHRAGERPVDPESVPDPRAEERWLAEHGRGLLLMRELLDHVEYRKGGSEVVLYKAFAPRP